MKEEKASLEEQNAALQKDMEARARGLPAGQGSGGGVGLDSFQIEQLRTENEKLRQAIRLYCFFLARFQCSIVLVGIIAHNLFTKLSAVLYTDTITSCIKYDLNVYFINSFYCTIVYFQFIGYSNWTARISITLRQKGRDVINCRQSATDWRMKRVPIRKKLKISSPSSSNFKPMY